MGRLCRCSSRDFFSFLPYEAFWPPVMCFFHSGRSRVWAPTPRWFAALRRDSAVTECGSDRTWMTEGIVSALFLCTLLLTVLLFIWCKFVKGFLGIIFLLLVFSNWNFHDVCQYFLDNQEQNFSLIQQTRESWWPWIAHLRKHEPNDKWQKFGLMNYLFTLQVFLEMFSFLFSLIGTRTWSLIFALKVQKIWPQLWFSKSIKGDN